MEREHIFGPEDAGEESAFQTTEMRATEIPSGFRNEADRFDEETLRSVENTGSTNEGEERGAELLALLSSENIRGELAVNERFGAGTWAKIAELGQNSLHKLETSGEKALNWAEEHGIPLPHSKLGNALAAGGLGIIGLAPGAGLLWGVAYIFAKRVRESGVEQGGLSDTLAVQQARSIMNT